MKVKLPVSPSEDPPQLCPTHRIFGQPAVLTTAAGEIIDAYVCYAEPPGPHFWAVFDIPLAVE